jgi:hypothetical protein
MNRYGNYCSSYDENAYAYNNADGSKYFANADGSSFYDPGTSGKGMKWYRSPNGVKHYIRDDEELEEFQYPEASGPPHQPAYEQYEENYYYERSQSYVPVGMDRTSHSLTVAPRKPQSARYCGPRESGGNSYSSSQSQSQHQDEGEEEIEIKARFKRSRQTSEPKHKEKEVHVHIHPRRAPTPAPVNVTKVVHHSSKGDKEVVYTSPARVRRDGKISKGERKVVHVHHHKGSERQSSIHQDCHSHRDYD